MRTVLRMAVVPLTLLSACAPAEAQPSEQLLELQRALTAAIPAMQQATVAVRIGTNRASGAIISGGWVVTTGHAAGRIGLPSVVLLPDGSRRESQVYGIDRTLDIALLKLDDGGGLQSVRFRVTPVTKREPVVALGSPGGFAADRPVVIRLGHAIGGDVLQSTCRLSRGDSGGPLFDLRGRLVGFHRQISKSSDANFHTNAAAVMKRLDRLKAGELIDGKPPRVIAQPVERNQLIIDPVREPPVIVQCNGEQVALATVARARPKTLLTKLSRISGPVTVVRGDQTAKARVIATDVALDLALLETDLDLPRPASTLTNPVLPGRLLISIGCPRTGAGQVSIVSAAARAIPAVRGEAGLLLNEQLTVTQVQPNSAAKKAGLRAGDRIESVDSRRVVSLDALGKALGRFNPGDRIALRCRRGDAVRTLSIRLAHPVERRFDNSSFQLGAAGKLSARRDGFASVVQHDALLNPEQCGGPVEDLQGRFLGLNIARSSREAVLMIPAAQLEEAVKRMLSSAEADGQPVPGD